MLEELRRVLTYPRVAAQHRLTPQELEEFATGLSQVLCTLDRNFYSPTVLAYCGQHGLEVLGDAELLSRLRAGKESSE